MSVYISLEATIAAAMRADDNGVSLEDAKKMSRAVVAELESIPAAEVKTLEEIGEEVDEALSLLDEAHGRMDYGDYCNLHDTIAGIAVPDFGADGKEAE